MGTWWGASGLCVRGPGGSGVTPDSGRVSDTFRGARSGPLNLIHTNNSPNPVSMRVSGRLTLENLTPVSLDSWLDFLAGPVGGLLLKRRAAHGATK